ncbi:glycine cleavage system H protein-like [Acropora millepora]|uniref:glycine cleavage system H protein-like n=1 Tax=Acropora millepora TaxID=45264 RepID=UPI001CF3EE2D|nr:glycine cleavage system H protein-like [Acropora millepora]
MAALRGASKLFPLVFNISTKRNVLWNSSYQLQRHFHITRKFLAERQFTKKHEWISVDNGIGMVGVTSYAQEQLGDIVYVQLPEIGLELEEGDVFGALESVKAAADVYSPVSGTVTEINNSLEDNPELVNQSPYDKGWLVKIELNEVTQPELLSEAAYDQFVKECQDEQ